MLGSTAAKWFEQLEFHASTGTARFYNDESRANEAPALPASGGILARGEYVDTNMFARSIVIHQLRYVSVRRVFT